MDRRGFLRGTLLTAPAVMLGPGVVDLIGGDETAHVALVEPEDTEPTRKEEHIMVRLESRVITHWNLFGEMPKALFVNRYEFDAYFRALPALRRWSTESISERGYHNLMFRGVPVICTDGNVLCFNPEGRDD